MMLKKILIDRSSFHQTDNLAHLGSSKVPAYNSPSSFNKDTGKLLKWMFTNSFSFTDTVRRTYSWGEGGWFADFSLPGIQYHLSGPSDVDDRIAWGISNG